MQHGRRIPRVVSTVGSAATTTPPLGTITHTYVPPNGPAGTYCLGLNVTTTSISTVADNTKAILQTCSSTDVTQQWGIRDGDGSIRLGNGSKCLTLGISDNLAPSFNVTVSTCVSGNARQKWKPVPKPPGKSATGYEPGSDSIMINRSATGRSHQRQLHHRLRCIRRTSHPHLMQRPRRNLLRPPAELHPRRR
ncbi:hypothetical protein C8F01DRAFT_751524 [Mycena amicta]|nr:hypothetical protein C8F01DRAFT_751524 [Mycena amicta]